MAPKDDRVGYWSIDLPGLSRDCAEELLELALERFQLPGSLVDPSMFFTLHIDEQTAEVVADALERGRIESISSSLRGNIIEWLTLRNG